MAVAIGIDVGGTKIAGGLVDADGTIVHEQRVATVRSDSGADPGAQATVALFHELHAHATSIGVDPVACGIGVPEYVSPNGVITSSEVLGWGPSDLDELRSAIPLIIESDVRCGALSELRCGHGREASSIAYVSIGTGISYALAIDGQLWRGHRGEAIALGELPVAAAAALFSDRPLTLEQQASGRALEPFFSDDNAAARAGALVASSIVSIVSLIDPELIILGGGLGSTDGPYTHALINGAQQALGRRPQSPQIIRCTFGAEAGLIGAALAAHDHVEISTTAELA